MGDVFDKAKDFIHRSARPLDFARWRYHFEQGSKEDVLSALSYYQSEDGGFGHALEPDAWNPNSSPIQTWTATEILREISFTDSSHPLIKGILRYLESGKDFERHYWLNTIKSNNDYPHAPWWHTDSESSSHHVYNPTACLAGFIVKHADKDSALYKLGCRIAGEAISVYIDQGIPDEMHSLHCFIRLMQYIEEAGAAGQFDVASLKKGLIKQVGRCVTQDTSIWETAYVCRPSQFFNTKDSIFYESNRDIADFERVHIVKTQREDGSWSITWGWPDYPDAWALSKNWWQSIGIIKNMLYLKGMGEIRLG